MTTTIPTAAPAQDDLRVLAVACPSEAGGCGSDPEARCTTPSGRATRPHTARIRAALAATERVTAPYSHPHPGEAGVPGAEAPAGTYAVDSAGTATEATPEPEAPAGATTEELVLRLLVLKVLAARVAEADADARDTIHGRVDVGVSLPGYLTPEDAAAARRGEGDRCLGKVGLSKPSRSWRVTDSEAFTAWALEHAPDEVEHRPVVRNSFVSAVLAACKADGGWIDPATSELLEVDGVELALGRPTLQVRPSGDAPDLVAEAIAAGLLTADGTRALPAGS